MSPEENTSDPSSAAERRRARRAGAAGGAQGNGNGSAASTALVPVEHGHSNAYEHEHRAGDHVDLGSVTEVEDGETLALRHYNEKSHAGLPTMQDEAPEVESAIPKGLVAQMVSDLKGYKDLRRSPYGYGPITILALIGFFQIFETGAFTVAGPDIVRDIQIKINTLIALQSYLGVVLLFVTLYAGWYLDRHRRAPWIGISTIVSGITGMAYTRASSILGIGTPRIIDDTATTFGDVPSFSLLADYYPPEDRGKVFAFLGTMSRIGSLLAIAVVGVTVKHLGWRHAGFIFALPLVPIGILALVRLKEPVRGYMERRAMGASDEESRVEDEPQSFGEAWRATWSVRTLRRLFIAASFAGIGSFGFTFYFSFYLAEKYHLDVQARSFIGGPPLVVALFAGVYGGAIIDRFIRKEPGRVLQVYGFFQLLSAIGLIGIAFKPPLIVLVLFNMVFAAGFALIGPALNVVYVQVVPPNIRTQGLQITNLSALPALIVGGTMYRSLFTAYGYSTVFLFGIPLLILAAIVTISAGAFFELDARSAFAATLASEEWRRAKDAGTGKLLVCRDVDVAYSGVQVLFGVDFDVEEGEIIALLGTNGAGKSTLLRAISGTSEASGGAIVFDGRDTTHMPPHEIAARGVVHMPGGRGVFPGLSVRDNLMLANWMTEDSDEIKKGLAEVFEIFPVLRERLDVDANTLSGGEQQQLSLAQAFLSRPRLLMIDELSLGLSPAVVGQLLEIVREIHRRGVTIVVVEQSVNVALTIADKAIFMEKGEVRFFGKTADLLARPDILRAVYVKGTGALTEGAPAGARRSERERRALQMGEARPVLEVEHLTKHYGGITAVNDVSFALREGEVLGLIGPNGAGKTTIFDLISGYQRPDEGKVLFDSVDVSDMSPEARAQRKLIRRFQDARLFPSLTVFETLLVALEQQLEVKNPVSHALRLPNARRAERRLHGRAERLIELLDLQSYRDKFVKELSTGLRRIVDLACVLATEPRVLLLDEPSSGIAQAEAEGLAPLIKRIRFEAGCSILIIEHDMPLISSVSDELLALDRGAVVLRGTPTEVLNDERVIESYLGTTEAAVNRSGRATT